MQMHLGQMQMQLLQLVHVIDILGQMQVQPAEKQSHFCTIHQDMRQKGSVLIAFSAKYDNQNMRQKGSVLIAYYETILTTAIKHY